MVEQIIGKNEAGRRFDKYLFRFLNEAGQGFIYKMLRKKNITLNGKKADGTETLKENDRVCFFFSDETFAKFHTGESYEAAVRKLPILYEDEQILLFNKPAGVLSQKAKPDDVSACEILVTHLIEEGKLDEKELASFRPSVCNRLDRNTSGILACGLTLPALQKLSELFRDRSLHKYYYALVSGRIDRAQRLEGYLIKDEKTNTVKLMKEPAEGADPVITEYEPVSASERVTLLRILLVTGKTHQIRAHLASIGHPILGDPKYGDARANASARSAYGTKRQLLHAAELQFPEIEGELAGLSGRTFTAPLPADFLKVMKGEGLCLPGIREG